jgi:anthranilate phosphoribosyltransferase
VTPEDAGLPRVGKDALKGGAPEDNAAQLRALLEGKKGPLRDVVLLNSAAALIVAGKAKDLKGGVSLAGKSIDGGKAGAALEKMVAITNEPAPLPPP